MTSELTTSSIATANRRFSFCCNYCDCTANSPRRGTLISFRSL